MGKIGRNIGQIYRLCNKSIIEQVVSENSLNDCRHVALATIHADGIVSWNLKDMVKREEQYNRVNAAQDYSKIKIVIPNKYKEIHHET